MWSRLSRLSHNSFDGLCLWVHRKAVRQMEYGWWRLHFDDNQCKRMIWRGCSRWVECTPPVLEFTSHLDLRMVGFNPRKENVYMSIKWKDLQNIKVKADFSWPESKVKPSFLFPVLPRVGTREYYSLLKSSLPTRHELQSIDRYYQSLGPFSEVHFEVYHSIRQLLRIKERSGSIWPIVQESAKSVLFVAFFGTEP